MEQEIKTYKITSPTGEVRIRVGTSYTECVQELGWPLAESHYEIIESDDTVLATRHSDNETIDVTLTEEIAFKEGHDQAVELYIKELKSGIEETLATERDTYDCSNEEDKNIQGWIEALEYVLREIEMAKIPSPSKKEPELPDGLQKYIDGVGLNVLYRNYPKSTNGIWSKAEIDEEMGDEWMGQDEYYVVNVDFGCQDDTRNEQYRERTDVWKDKETGEWTCDFVKESN